MRRAEVHVHEQTHSEISNDEGEGQLPPNSGRPAGARFVSCSALTGPDRAAVVPPLCTQPGSILFLNLVISVSYGGVQTKTQVHLLSSYYNKIPTTWTEIPL